VVVVTNVPLTEDDIVVVTVGVVEAGWDAADEITGAVDVVATGVADE